MNKEISPMTPDEMILELKAQRNVLAIHIESAEKGIIQEDCIECRKKDLETLDRMIDCLSSLMGYKFVGPSKFYFPSTGKLGGFIAIDDSTGDKWTEWFPTEEQAISYLKADYGNGEDFRHECSIETIDVPRGIGPSAKELIIALKPAKRSQSLTESEGGES